MHEFPNINQSTRAIRRRLLLGFAFALAVWPLAQAAAENEDRTPVSIRLDWSYFPYHEGFIIAQEKGYYAAEKLDVKIEQGQGSSATATLVAQGKNDFGFADPTTSILSVDKGMPIKIVQVIRRQAGFGVTCFSKFAVSTPSEIEGRSVLMTPGEAVSQIWPAFIAANGLDESKIKVVNAPSSSKVSLFAQGNVADCMAGVPAQAATQAHLLNPDIPAAGMAFDQFGIHMLGHSIIANNDFLRDNGDTVRRFLAATTKGFRDMCADPAKSAEDFIVSVEKLTSLPLSKSTRDWARINMPLECDLMQPGAGDSGAAFGPIAVQQWEGMLDILKKYGNLQSSQPVSTYYTNDFLPH